MILFNYISRLGVDLFYFLFFEIECKTDSAAKLRKMAILDAILSDNTDVI